jgi:hypothetical protein
MDAYCRECLGFDWQRRDAEFRRSIGEARLD